MKTLASDLKFATRTLAKSPGFTLVAILSLALGIGANTAIFSLIDAVMLRMLPVSHPEQLVSVNTNAVKTGSVQMFEKYRCRRVARTPGARDNDSGADWVYAVEGSLELASMAR